MQSMIKKTSATILAMLVLMLLAASPVWAIPNLQIYIPEATYDHDSETWVIHSYDYELWVIGAHKNVHGVKFAMAVPENENGQVEVNWITPSESDYGSPSVQNLNMTPEGGLDYSDYRDSYADNSKPDPSTYGYGVAENGDYPLMGDGSDVPPHGVFPTDFYEYYIGDLGTDDTVQNYIPGDEWGDTAPGEMKKFDISVTGYTWLDIVAYNHVLLNHNKAKYVFSPFSHDGAVGTPEPATMLLFGTGLIGLAWVGRRHLQRRNDA